MSKSLFDIYKLEDSAPLKLPIRNCLSSFFPPRLENITNKMAISLSTPRYPRVRFKVSPLCYVCKSYPQYQTAVKLLGSFRLTAGNRHLHRYCIFTEQIPETVLQSLYHSCTSELHYSLLNKFNANPLFLKEWTISLPTW